MALINLKNELYNILKNNFEDCFISQVKPRIFKHVPAIIFQLVNQNIEYDLNYNISNQEMTFQIDIWDRSSVNATNILSRLENVLIINGYLLEFVSDVPNDGNLFHIVTRFKTIT